MSLNTTAEGRPPTLLSPSMFSARALHATLFSEFGGVYPQGLGSCPVVSRLLSLGTTTHS